MRRKKLLIISHTQHYKDKNNQVVGWGATINEVNFLADYWEEVVHIGCLYHSEAPKSSLPYIKTNIRFVPIPAYGGKTVWSKIGILFKIPIIINRVVTNVKEATEIQLRLPTSMGLFLLPLFSFFLPRKYTFWVKYAGNWQQQNPPMSYRIQRWWLKKNIAKCKVTINGFWNNQPKNCFSFENPCLSEQDILRGKEIANTKSFHSPFTFCFVGRLNEAKGVSEIIEALKHIPLNKINKVHFVGDGENIEKYKLLSSFLGEKVIFHGFLESGRVHQLLADSHFFLLPSKSEGFPKVIAEACCYGTIPIVSNVGSISHYINNQNGYLVETDLFSNVLFSVVTENEAFLKNISSKGTNVAELFTFEKYKSKLENTVF